MDRERKMRLRIKKKVIREGSRLFRRDRNGVCGKIIEYGILGLIIFSPLPAASVAEWSILVIQLTVLVMMAAYFMMREKPKNNGFLSLSLKWPKYLFLGLFVFIFIQIIPLPKFLIKVFSPNTYSFQELFSTDFSKIKFMSLSSIPAHTLREGLELLSYFLLGFLIVKTVTNRRQIMRIFYVLIAMGVFEAFYGLFELYNKNPRILFYEKNGLLRFCNRDFCQPKSSLRIPGNDHSFSLGLNDSQDKPFFSGWLEMEGKTPSLIRERSRDQSASIFGHHNHVSSHHLF